MKCSLLYVFVEIGDRLFLGSSYFFVWNILVYLKDINKYLLCYNMNVLYKDFFNIYGLFK